MKQLKKFGLACLLILLAACDKKQKVFGTVKEYGTNIPLAGVKVTLNDFDDFRPFGGHLWGKDKSYVTITDQAGNFSFGVKRVNSKQRWILDRISFELPGYSAGSEDYVKSLNDILLAPNVTIKFHLKNIYTQNTDVKFRFEFGVFPGYNENKALNLDTVIFRQALGNSHPNFIKWRTVNGSTVKFRDTIVYCPGRDTAALTINF